MESYQDGSIQVHGRTDDGEQQERYRFKLTMEIPIFLTMLGLSLSGAPISNLILYRTCVHSLGYPKDVCRTFLAPGKINHTTDLENEVQTYAAIVSSARSIIESLAPAVMSIFIGVWSDKHGRKPLVVWPLLGMSLSGILTVVYAMLGNLGPWWYIVTVVPFSLSGGFGVMLTGAICHVSDISTTEKRSIRLVYINVAFAVGNAIGSWICPYLLEMIGNVYLLLIVAALYTYGYAFTIISIEESLITAVQGSITTVLDCSHVKEMVHVCLKRRPNFGRAAVHLLLMASFLSTFTIYGNAGLVYLYTRAKIEWTMKDFTKFSATSTVMWFSGSVLAVTVFQKRFRISDLSFVAIAYLSCAAEFTIKAFAVNTWQMYLGSAVSLFGTVSGSLTRSYLTKLLPSNDIAKVFGLLGAMDSICPLTAPLLYNFLYVSTLATFPGAFFLLSICIILICCILVWIVQFITWRRSSLTYEIIEES